MKKIYEKITITIFTDGTWHAKNFLSLEVKDENEHKGFKEYKRLSTILQNAINEEYSEDKLKTN